MKKSLLFALLAAMPLMAQDCPDKPACGPKHPCCFGKMHRPHGPRPELSEEQKAEMKAKFEERKAEVLAKFDADKDGKLSCEERKAAHEARKAEMKAKFMEKFDADKDGQLSDAEKEAAKAEFKKHGPRHGKCCGPKGPRPELSEEQKAEMKAKFEERKAEVLAKFDADKDGKLSCEERKAAHEAHKAEMKAKFMEKFDADKDGKLSDAEKEAVKAEFKNFHKRGPKGPRPCCGPECGKH